MANLARISRVPADDSPGDLLAEAGELGYRWTIADDGIRWEGDLLGVLGIDPEAIQTGRSFAAYAAPGNSDSRHDAVFGSRGADRGGGVPFQVEYALRPKGLEGPIVWVEDCGRWFGDGGAHPARVVGIIRVITDRREREKRLAYRSSHDELTGFFNRAHLLDLLNEVLAATHRLQSSAGFLVIAIDNFRLLNDTYGFDVADQALAAIAKRLGTKLRGGDAIGRYSGNKIAVILHDCEDRAMKTAAERFLAVIRNEVITTDGGALAVSVSIGGVTLPRHARSVSEATTRAEESLYAARMAGGGKFAAYVHSPRLETRRRANAALSTEMISALNEGRLRLAFQPIIDIETRRPAFYEALLRLASSDGEIIPASSFMPLSETLGLSRLLDQRALELAIEALRSAPAITLSLNVTAATTTEPAWMELLSAAIGNQPDLARRLIVEITESTAIHNLDEAARFIATLKAFGCRVAMDDFGAGHTSFRNLRRLSLDMVKIDGGYVENLKDSPDDRVFVKTLVELARNFDFKTVAEWVRDEESIGMMKSWGVDYLQGEVIGPAELTLPAA